MFHHGWVGQDATARIGYSTHIDAFFQYDETIAIRPSLSYSVLARDGSYVLPFPHSPANKIWLEAAAAFRFGVTNEGAET